MNIDEVNRLFRKYNLKETDNLCWSWSECNNGNAKCGRHNRELVSRTGTCSRFNNHQLRHLSVQHLLEIQAGMNRMIDEYEEEKNSINERLNASFRRLFHSTF